MTTEQQIEAGRELANILMLRRDPEHKSSRWQTTWGSKTDLGIWQTVSRIVDEARTRIEEVVK